MAITVGLVEAVDSNGVYVSMPGTRGVLRGPFRSLSTVAVGVTALVASTDDGEQVVVGPAPGGQGAVSVAAFGAKGDGVTDDTAALQAALDAAAGKVVVVPAGNYKLTDTVDVPAGTTLRMHQGAVLLPQDAETTCLTLAQGATLDGGAITSPEQWDGTNDVWTYAVVLIEDDDVTVRDVTLTNVPRIGIGIREGDNILISGCRITGNVPDDYDIDWTVIFGICQDSKSSTANGNLVVTGNIISSCIQGVFSGNWGSGGPGRGLTVSGNTFYSCFDHGVYAAQGEGYSITGNSFNRCGVAIAATGSYHTVSGNAITTGLATDTRLDVTGISVRDPIGCVISNNTVKGETLSGTVMVDVTEVTGTVCRDNVIVGNTVVATDGSEPSIGIRCGDGDATDYRGNVIANNVVRAPGRQYLGVIHAQADSGATVTGATITGNTVVITGPGYGIAVASQVGASVSGNDVRLEVDADSADTIGMIVVNACEDTLVSSNRLTVTADWGDNIAVRGVWEGTGTTGTRIEGNVHSYDPTKLTSAENLSLQSGSGVALVNEWGTGAPGFAARIGSQYHRIDGGAGTALYIKESGTDSTGWVGK